MPSAQDSEYITNLHPENPGQRIAFNLALFAIHFADVLYKLLYMTHPFFLGIN